MRDDAEEEEPYDEGDEDEDDENGGPARTRRPYHSPDVTLLPTDVQ